MVSGQLIFIFIISFSILRHVKHASAPLAQLTEWMALVRIPNVQWGALNFGYFGEFLRLSTQLARSYWRWKLNLEVPYDLLNNLTVL